MRRGKIDTNAYTMLKLNIINAEDLQAVKDLEEMTEEMLAAGKLNDVEHGDLVYWIRERRQELAKPEPVVITVNGPGVYRYHPELGEVRPDCQMDADLMYYGRHYNVVSDIQLKGRGITKGQDGDYTVTTKAFEKLATQYSVAMKIFLD